MAKWRAAARAVTSAICVPVTKAPAEVGESPNKLSSQPSTTSSRYAPTDLCVFKGTGARVFAKANECPLSHGRNFTLEETIKLGANEKNAAAMWGRYEIGKKAFDVAVKRK